MRWLIVFLVVVLSGCTSSLSDTQFDWCLDHLSDLDRAGARVGLNFKPSEFIIMIASSNDFSTGSKRRALQGDPEIVKACQAALQNS